MRVPYSDWTRFAILILGAGAANAQMRQLPVVIAYTTAAADYLRTSRCPSGTCTMDRVLSRAVTDFNMFAGTSGLNFRIRAEQQINVVVANESAEITQIAACRNLLQAPPAALAPVLSTTRKLVVVVAMFHYTGGYTCRPAQSTATGFSVVHADELARGPDEGYQSQIFSTTLAHELAHQLGAGHQSDAVGQAGIPPAAAYYLKVDGSDKIGFKTIVTAPTQDLRNLPHCFCFSNPNLTFVVNGTAYPTGTANANNAARMMRVVDDLWGSTSAPQPPSTLRVVVQ